MNYIVCKNFNQKGIDGNFNLSVGDILVKNDDGYLYSDGRRVCYYASQNAYDYFMRDDDSKGSQRYALIEEIKGVIADYVSDYNEEIAAINNGDLTDEQKEAEIANVVDKCSAAYDAVKHNQNTANLLNNLNVWNVNFYNASIQTLTQIKSLIENI